MVLDKKTTAATTTTKQDEYIINKKFHGPLNWENEGLPAINDFSNPVWLSLIKVGLWSRRPLVKIST